VQVQPLPLPRVPLHAATCFDHHSGGVADAGFGITDPGYELHHRGSFLFNAGGPQTSWKTVRAC